jgi:hypothetical protein
VNVDFALRTEDFALFPDFALRTEDFALFPDFALRTDDFALIFAEHMKPILLHTLLWSIFLLPFLANAAAPPAIEHDLVLTEAEWETPNIIRIPFTLTGTLITVRARLDTLEGNFFFDTGASSLLLNYRRQVGRNLLNVGQPAGGVTGKVRVLGASKIDTFLMDNLQVVNLAADWIDMSHIERSKKIDLLGIIGYNVFEGYEVLFDYQAYRLVLIRTDPKGNPVEALPNWEYQLLGDFPVVIAGHVAIANLAFGEKGRRSFALDSGAEQNLLSFNTGGRFLKSHFEIKKRVSLNGAGKESIEVFSGVLQNGRIDTFRVNPMTTLLINMDEINATYQTNVDGVLGYEFLSQRPVSINYKKKRLRLYGKFRP